MMLHCSQLCGIRADCISKHITPHTNGEQNDIKVRHTLWFDKLTADARTIMYTGKMVLVCAYDCDI